MSSSFSEKSRGLGPVVRLAATLLVVALPLSACVTSGPTSNAASQPALPASAKIVRTADLTFPPVVLPSSKKPDAGQQSVVFLNSSTGFLARGGPAFGTSSGGTYLPDPGGIERTSDGGKTWTAAWAQPGASLTWIGFQSSAVGFAAGTQFDTSSTTSSTGKPLWLRTSDAGASWTPITPRMPAAVAGAWASMQFAFATATLGVGVPDPDAQMAGNRSVMIRTTDGGQSWSQVALQNWTPTGGLTFLSSTQAFATGYIAIPTGRSSGQLWTSTDVGQSWRPIAGTRVPFLLYAVDFSDRLHGFAAGGQFAKYEERPWRGLLATSDGGRTWSVGYLSPDADRSNPITRLRFVDSTHGWAAIGGCTEGQNGPCAGGVMVTGDGGRSWQMTRQIASQLSATSPTEAWAVDSGRDPAAGIPWHTTDAGANWQGVVRPGALAIDSLIGSKQWLLAHSGVGAWTSNDSGQTWVPFNPPILESGPFVNTGMPTILVESPDLVVVADGTALRVSQDAGREWTPVTLPTDDPNNTATALAFRDSRNGIAIVGNQQCVKPQPGVAQGSAAVLTTADGGLTWQRQTTLARYATALSAAKGLAVTTGGAGCGGPAQHSIAISHDDGRRWATQSLPFDCSAVSVAAPATIWLTCYADQTVYLATQDGGQTWTKYLSPGIGAAFLVTGPSEVWAYGPPGALWHTTDAGRHWASWLPSF